MGCCCFNRKNAFVILLNKINELNTITEGINFEKRAKLKMKFYPISKKLIKVEIVNKNNYNLID